MARIELSQLVAEMTPEQKIFMQGFYAQFDNRSAVNRRIVNVEPITHYGLITGTEFATYAATKLYIMLSCIFAANAPVMTGVNGVLFYNENNTLNFNLGCGYPYWDATAAAVRYYGSGFSLYNMYFSRIDVSISVWTRMQFIGYRITLA